MKSICKNCCHSQRYGQHLLCERTLKYVPYSYKCKYFAEEVAGDIDNKVYAAFAVVMFVLGILIAIFSI